MFSLIQNIVCEPLAYGYWPFPFYLQYPITNEDIHKIIFFYWFVIVDNLLENSNVYEKFKNAFQLKTVTK